MEEIITKDNDFTLTVTHLREEVDNSGYIGIKKSSSLRRTFNFLSAQVTTIVRDEIYQSRGSSVGGSASVSVNTVIQNFDDIQSSAEIKYYHGVLIKQNGKPPPLEDIFPTISKQRGVGA
jgi:hypothetical protein